MSDEVSERLARALAFFPSHPHLAGVLEDFATREVARELARELERVVELERELAIKTQLAEKLASANDALVEKLDAPAGETWVHFSEVAARANAAEAKLAGVLERVREAERAHDRKATKPWSVHSARARALHAAVPEAFEGEERGT